MKSPCRAPRVGGPRFRVLAPGLAVHSACRPAPCRGEQRGASLALPPASPPPGHRAVSTDSPRHGFLIKILIFSTPLSPRFSLEHKQHSACYSGAGHGTARGRHVSLLEDVTSRRGQGHRGGWGWALLCWGTWPAPPRPSTRSRGHSSSERQRAASGSPHYLERKGPGGAFSGRSTRLLHAAERCRWPRGSLHTPGQAEASPGPTGLVAH